MELTACFFAATLAIFCFVDPILAQDTNGPIRPEAAAEDVSTIDAIITATYDVISGTAEDERDWDRERSLFHSDSRHIPTRMDASGTFVADVMDVEAFIKRSAPFFKSAGFYEYEIARKVEHFGNIAHVFSTYEWRHNLDGPVGGRGINSFQLLYDGTRWWIMSVFWQQESDAYPIPDKYVHSDDR